MSHCFSVAALELLHHPVLYALIVIWLSVVAVFSRERYLRTEPRVYAWMKTPPILWLILCLAVDLWDPARTVSDGLQPLRIGIFCGLVAGFIGDVFLLWKRTFLIGFTAFALGHIIYAIFFVMTGIPEVFAVAVIPIAILGLFYGSRLRRRVLPEQRSRLPLAFAYTVLIGFMLAAAISADMFLWILESNSGPCPRPPEYEVIRRLPWFAIGAAFFCVSDSLWAWNRFVKPLPLAGAWILGTYYAAQALIVWGAVSSNLPWLSP